MSAPSMAAATLVHDLTVELRRICLAQIIPLPPIVERAERWISDATSNPVDPKALPEFVNLTPCRKCGQDIFFAKLPNGGKSIPLVPCPIEVDDDLVVVGALYVDFSGGNPVVLHGKIGTRYIPHGAICGTARPEEPIAARVWDRTYGVLEQERLRLAHNLIEMSDDLSV